MKNNFELVRKLPVLCLCLFLLLTSCAPASTPTQASDQKVTSSGFVCPQPNPRLTLQSDKLNLFTWTEYIPAEIIECFGLVYGVQVNAEYFSSNEELYAKLSTIKGSNPYDVIHPSDYMIDVLAREGILEKIDWKKISNSTNLNPDYTKLYGAQLDYVVPYQLGTQAIVYNSKTVKNPPKSWADLWSPEYKKRIVAVDDSRVIIGAALLTLGYDVNTKNTEELNAAKQKLLELMPNIKVFDSDSPKTSLISGDTDLGIVWNGEAYLAQQENPDFKYVLPSEGAIMFQDGMGIPTGAPHADAAYAWFNYLLQGDVFWLTMRDFPYTNPNTASIQYAKLKYPDIYNNYMRSSVTNTSAADLAASHAIKDVGDALLLYDKIWTEVKGGN